MSEERLWCAVIIQALIDATSKPKLPFLKVAQVQAHNWLTVEAGTTASDFEAVCLGANMDPERVRKFYTEYKGPPLTLQSLTRLRDGNSK